MKNPSRSVALSTLLAGVCLGLAGCSPAQQEAPPPPAVSVSPAVEQNITDYNLFTGRTDAVESVKIRARVWGYLKKIDFKEGEEVQKDQVLFEIDPDAYQAAADQAKGRLAVAQAQDSLTEEVAKRNQVLRLKGALSQEEYEKSESDRASAAASLNSARADLRRAQLDLDYTQIRAPVAGRVGRAMATVGNLVQSGEMGGTVLTSLVSVDPMWVYFDVDDLTFLNVNRLLRQGKVPSTTAAPPVQMGLTGEDGYPHEGVIDFVDNQVDGGTGTIRMRGVFSNKDRTLTPGLFARVRVPVAERHKAMLIPDRAVDTDQGEKVVYVVGKDNVVEKRPVRLGGLHDGLREIESGVQAGESIIVDGIQMVRAGVIVAPKPALAQKE